MIVLIGRQRKNPIESADEVRFAIKTRDGIPRAEGDGGWRSAGAVKREGVGGYRRPKGRNKCTHCAELVD